jgi:iron complex transport system substrate-binding protein
MASRRITAWRKSMLLAAALANAAPTAAADGSVTVIDAAGRRVSVADASRIVSIGGAITEILYALGLQKQVAAIDSTSLYPPRALKEKPNVGYMRQLSAEGVLGLNPSVVLATEGSGPKETLAVLRAARVPFVLVPDRYTADSVVDKIRMVSQIAGVPARGKCLATAIQEDLAALTALRARTVKPKRVLFVLSFMNGRPMVAGRNTAADGIIALAGGVNAVTGFEGYKQVNDEAVIAAQPEVILVITRDGHHIDADTTFRHPALAASPAAARRAFVAMDGLYLLSFGPRTAQAVRDLAARLYPELPAHPQKASAPATDCR